MTETLTYGLIGQQDLFMGTGTFQVTLPDGSVATLTKIGTANTGSTTYGGTGLDTSAKTGVPFLLNGTWTLPMGGAWNGTTNDTAAWVTAINWLNAAQYRALLLPAGNSLITAGGVPAITQSNVSVIGQGSGATRITVTGTGIGLQVGTTPPITTEFVYSPRLEGFGIYKTGSGTQTALKVIGPQFGRFRDLTLYTGYTSPSGDIGLDLYGKSENSFMDLWIEADLPIRMDRATATDGDGVDHANFHNLTMYSMRNANPLIKLQPGTVSGNLSFTGQQAWIGGNAGFYCVESSAVGNHGSFVFENIRREDNTTVAATRTSGYSVHMDIGAVYSVAKVISRNCRMSIGPGTYQMDGFNIISNYLHVLIEGYKDSGGTGHAFLTTSSSGAATDSIVLIDCEPGQGTITTTNLALAFADGQNTADAFPLRIYNGNSTNRGVTVGGASGATGYTRPLYLGAYAVWVASNGKMYKKNGAPTSDTDGTVVGTES